MDSRSRSAAVIFLAPSFIGAGFARVPATPRAPAPRAPPTVTCPPTRAAGLGAAAGAEGLAEGSRRSCPPARPRTSRRRRPSRRFRRRRAARRRLSRPPRVSRRRLSTTGARAPPSPPRPPPLPDRPSRRHRSRRPGEWAGSQTANFQPPVRTPSRGSAPAKRRACRWACTPRRTNAAAAPPKKTPLRPCPRHARQPPPRHAPRVLPAATPAGPADVHAPPAYALRGGVHRPRKHVRGSRVPAASRAGAGAGGGSALLLPRELLVGGERGGGRLGALLEPLRVFLHEVQERLRGGERAVAHVLLHVADERGHRGQNARRDFARLVVRRGGAERHQPGGARGRERVPQRSREGVQKHALRGGLGEVPGDVAEQNGGVGADRRFLVDL